jgi:hypothetical protein
VSFSLTGRKAVREMAANVVEDEGMNTMKEFRVEEGSRYHVKWNPLGSRFRVI